MCRSDIMNNNLKEHEGSKCENCKVGKLEYYEELEKLVCSCCEGEIQ